MGLEWRWALPPAGREDVAALENALGVKLPEDYVTCALRHHGGRPTRNRLDFGGEQDKVFQSLLALRSVEGDPGGTVLGAHQNLRQLVEDARIVPFADDPAGNLYVFDYRRGERPSILYWDHEQAAKDDPSEPEFSLTPVAGSFTELLDKLYEPAAGK
jgi:cell wall assembly regulator SMI1